MIIGCGKDGQQSMADDTARVIKVRIKQALAPIARLVTKNRPRILMYHRFGQGDPARILSAKGLDTHLSYLRRHFNVVRLSDLVTRLKSGATFDPYSVALTIDDGYADFGEHAYPVFKKYGIPVTLYVVSEFAGGGLWLWWDAIRYLLTNAADGRYVLARCWQSPEIQLANGMSRHNAWLQLAEIGGMLSPNQRDTYLVDLQNALSVALPASPTREFAALDWGELRSLDPDIVNIGAHTRTHPILSRCDSARIVEEVAGSKRVIEEQLGRPVSAFCYPNGGWPDVDDRCISAVREAGFDNAVMACGAMITRNANPYALERMSAPHFRGEFECDVSGIAYIRQAMFSDWTWLTT